MKEDILTLDISASPQLLASAKTAEIHSYLKIVEDYFRNQDILEDLKIQLKRKKAK